MGELLNGWKRTCYCTELTEADLGKEVTLMGWTNVRRGPRRADLRAAARPHGADAGGVRLQHAAREDFARASKIRSEYVLAIRGRLVARTGNMVNPNMKTGSLEVRVTEFKILSASETPPIEIEDNCKSNEALRLKYRYLDLRRPCMQRNLMMRHKIAFCARRYFSENGFLEIETPILTKSTPEGARDYLVPSRVHPGHVLCAAAEPAAV